MIFELIDKLKNERTLSDNEFLYMLDYLKSDQVDEKAEQYLYQKADEVRQSIYSRDIYIRGLIEVTNICKNDCYYCGIRANNPKADRYRLTKEEILACCAKGYELGFRTFVLQGGEDLYFTDERICDLVSSIKNAYPDCAITLSIGEKPKESYRAYFEAGADRYLLRHETADFEHYGKLHPKSLSPEFRQKCLYELKDIGYQIGCGIMVGSPFQTNEHILKDLRFMEHLNPHMIGIGPFIPHKDTPFAKEKAGTLSDTLHLLSILRLMFPSVLLPATTALGTIHPLGREMGIKAGANVIMPNLSPADVKEKYLLYDGKLCKEDEATKVLQSLKDRMESIGYQIVESRGDHISDKND